MYNLGLFPWQYVFFENMNFNCFPAWYFITFYYSTFSQILLLDSWVDPLFIPINSTAMTISPTLEPQFLLFPWFCFSSHSQAYSGYTEPPSPLSGCDHPLPQPWVGSEEVVVTQEGRGRGVMRMWEGSGSLMERRVLRGLQAYMKFLGWGHLLMLEGGGREPQGERIKVLDKRSKISWRD